MKLLAPLSSVEEIDILLNEGVDEIYCGIMDDNIISKYGLPILNARPSRRGNLKDIKSLEFVVKRSHKKGVPVYVAFNSPIFNNIQMDMAKETIQIINDIGVDAIILSDIGLLTWISQNNFNFKIHMSSLASCYNNWTIELYKSLGASRIVLPRHMSINEIKQIVSTNENIEFEVFALNTLCENDDGFCSYDHNIANCTNLMHFDCGGCRLEKGIKLYIKKTNNNIPSIRDFAQELKRRRNLYKEACGACAITELSKYNISSLKIVGREFSLDKKLLDIRFIKQLKQLISNNDSDKDIKELVKELYRGIYKAECRERCYY